MERFPEEGTVSYEAPLEAARELERILKSRHFRGSQRCGDFLRYVVENKLNGNLESLKERTLATELFGRPADFNTAEDAVVRVTANAVRKRLAQYYQEPDPSRLLRIELPPGTYLPAFTWIGREAASSPLERSKLRRGGGILLAAGLLVAAVLTLYALLTRTPQTELFWRPFVSKSPALLVCIASPQVYHPTPELAERLIRMRSGPPLPPESSPAIPPDMELRGEDIRLSTFGYAGMGDAYAAAKLGSLLGGHGKAFEIRASNETSFADLQRASVVLIGASANRWTMHFNERLELPIEWDPSTRSASVRDRRRPGRVWRVVRNESRTALEGYAVVARFFDRETQRHVLIIAGLTHHANYAAAEFLTNDQLLESVLSRQGKGWHNRSLELLLKNRIVGTSPAVPEVVEARVW